MTSNNFKDKYNIIIAEDNTINLFFLKTLIKMNFPQIHIFEADSGDKVLDFFKLKIDLLILDLGLPVVHGFDIIKQMKAREDLKNIPIVIITATDYKKIEKQLKNYGIKTYMQKPAKKEIIIDAIKTYLPI